MSKKQDMDDPTCVLKMLDEFRSCNPSVNLPSIIGVDSKTLVPTRLRFDDSTVLTENKKKIFTGNNVSVSSTEACVEDSDVTVLGKFTNSVIQ
jgi:hypothetical protein